MSKTGHQFVESGDRNTQLQKLFSRHKGMMQLEPGSWVLCRIFQEYADRIASYEFEENDVIVMSMPKSGTTWTQEIVWTMKNNPNLEHPMANLPLNLRTPVLGINSATTSFDMHVVAKELFGRTYPGSDHSDELLRMAKMAPKPTVFKTHLPLELISPTALTKAKVVYVVRDPRDVCISFHHHVRIWGHDNFTGTFDDLMDAFINGALQFGPYWGHVNQAWNLRDHPNLHILFYEKLLKNTKDEYMKLSKFLGTDISDEEMAKIIEYTNFDEMKKRDNHAYCKPAADDVMNKMVAEKEGGFFRQGESGGWRKVLTLEQRNKFQVWIDENCPDQEILNIFLNA